MNTGLEELVSMPSMQTGESQLMLQNPQDRHEPW